MRTHTALLAVLVVLVAVAGQAQVPATLSYQGVLRDAAGVPVADDDYAVDFVIYDAGAGGTALWLEPLTVTTSDGIFDVILGETVPLGLPFDVQYWLGTSVEGEAELAPRVQLTAAPYSLRAVVAETALVSAPDSDWQISTWNEPYSMQQVGIGTDNPHSWLHVAGDGNGLDPIVQAVGPTYGQPAFGFRTVDDIGWGFEQDWQGRFHLTVYDDTWHEQGRPISVDEYGVGIFCDPVSLTGLTVNYGLRTDDLVVTDGTQLSGRTTTDTLRVIGGAAAGHVLTSDGMGLASWQTPASVPDSDWQISAWNEPYSMEQVGIGTDNPHSWLHVVGDGNGLDPIVQAEGPTYGQPAFGFRTVDDIGWGFEQDWQGRFHLTVYDDTWHEQGRPISVDEYGVGIFCDPEPLTGLTVNNGLHADDLVVTDGTQLFGRTTTDTLRVIGGAADGYVMTSDAAGLASWQPAPPPAVPGSSGRLLYNDGGAMGAAELYYNDSPARLGIGRSPTQERLEVDGTAMVDGFILTSSPDEGLVLTSDASGEGTWQPVTGDMITDGTISQDDLGTDSVGSSEIKSNSVHSDELASNVVGLAHLADTYRATHVVANTNVPSAYLWDPQWTHAETPEIRTNGSTGQIVIDDLYGSSDADIMIVEAGTTVITDTTPYTYTPPDRTAFEIHVWPHDPQEQWYVHFVGARMGGYINGLTSGGYGQ